MSPSHLHSSNMSIGVNSKLGAAIDMERGPTQFISTDFSQSAPPSRPLWKQVALVLTCTMGMIINVRALSCISHRSEIEISLIILIECFSNVCDYCPPCDSAPIQYSTGATPMASFCIRPVLCTSIPPFPPRVVPSFHHTKPLRSSSTSHVTNPTIYASRSLTSRNLKRTHN